MKDYLHWEDGGRLCTAYRDDGSKVTGHVDIYDVITGDPEIPIINIVTENGKEFSVTEFDKFLVS